jgi:hypothetical protein
MGFRDPLMDEAIRRAQEMDTPAMREAMKRAQEMDTPAMRAAIRRAQEMDTPAMRAAARRAQEMNTPAMREATRRAQEMNTPAVRELVERSQAIDSSAMREIINRRLGAFDGLAVSKLISSPAFQTLAETATRHSALNSFATVSAFGGIKDFVRQSEAAFRIVNPPWGQSTARLIQRHETADLFALRAISEVAQFISYNRSLEGFPASFAGAMLTTLSAIEEPTDEESLQRFVTGLEDLLDLVISKCKELTPNSINYWAMFNFALSIFFFLYPLYVAQQSENRVMDSVNQTRIEMLEKVESLKPSDDICDVYYVVERKVKLKTQPRSKSPNIEVLSTNQRLKLLKSKGKWIYVEYFDYVEGIPKTGWLLKKYAQRLED